MENGSRYVVYSQDTLYRLPNSSCSEGNTVSLSNQTVVRYRLIGSRWVAQDNYSTGNYSNTSYICHVWSSDFDYQFDYSNLVLPALFLVFGLFWFLYKMLWGARR